MTSTQTIVHLIHDFPMRGDLEIHPHDPAYSLRADQREIILALTSAEPEITEADKEDWVEAVIRARTLIDQATAAGAALWGARTLKNALVAADLVPMNEIARIAGATAETVFYDLGTHDWRRLYDYVQGSIKTSLTIREIASRHVPYAFNPGFQSLAGRRFILCNLNKDEPDRNHPGQPSLKSQIGAFAGKKAVWKLFTCRLKEANVEIFDFTGKTADKCRLPEDFIWSTMHLTGTCAVQDYVEMGHEYRVFVVNGRAQAGAGCVEDLTPLYAGVEPFSPTTEERRNSGAGLKLSYERANRYRAFAELAAKAIADADPAFPTTFVIDLFETPNGDIGIIELNPLLASGLYATNYRFVAQALIEACQNDAAATDHFREYAATRKFE